MYIYLVYIGDDVMFFVFIFFMFDVINIIWMFSMIYYYLYYYYVVLDLMLDVRYDGGIVLLFFLVICNVIVLDGGYYIFRLINVDGMIYLLRIILSV